MSEQERVLVITSDDFTASEPPESTVTVIREPKKRYRVKAQKEDQNG